MDYKILPFCNVWQDGIFNAPVSLVDKYLKLSSEYQLKALLFVLRNNGQASSAMIGKALGQTAGDIDELLEFWVDEGVLSVSDDEAVVKAEPVNPSEPVIITQAKQQREKLSAPRLSPKDVGDIIRSDDKLCFLLNEAQGVLARSLSHAEQEMLINMVSYYGLNAEIVLMILEFYRAEKQRGKSIGISYVNSLAKAWSDEGVSTIGEAEEKLKELERGDRLWKEVVAMTGIRHRRPTDKQRKMVSQWFDDFDVTMINLACDIMKENTSEPKLTYVNKVLENWKKENVTTPAQVQAKSNDKQSADKKRSGHLKSTPSYDLEKIKRDAMNNTDI